MKNVLKGLFVASFMMSLAACKNDKPSTENATTTATPVAASTPVADTSTPIPLTGTVPPPPVLANAASSKTATEPVKPAAAQTTPAAAPAAAATGKTTAIKFDELNYNWGSVAEGDKMTHIFKFKNTGSNDLIISDAHGSCGCTVPEWPKEPIKPGKSGEIKVVFDSKGKPGDQQKTVTLTANTEPANTVLTIKGNVKASESK
ncbi:MAG: DUF1573 domain-containing protein [Saprospiraceae bacterium]|nr:DUF1573 domain-containing protein [Saprospiraceae bacterium]